MNDILGRMGRGDRIAAGGAVALFISLFMPWFGLTTGSSVVDQALGSIGATSVNAFRAFGFIDILLLLISLAVVGGLVMIAMDRIDSGLRRIVEVAGGIATLLVLWGMYDNAKLQAIGLKFGAFVGLLGAVAIAVGGYVNRQDGVV